MYNFKRLSFFFFLLIFLSACSSSLPELIGVDSNNWKADRNGCNGIRANMIEAITAEKEKLKTLSEMDLIHLLGRPDVNQLLERNQKFYIYYLEPGPVCDHPSSNQKKLILRINAMGLTKETLIK